MLQPVKPLPEDIVRNTVGLALREDGADRDATTLATVPAGLAGRATVVAREPLVLSGIDLALEAFRQISKDFQFYDLRDDGAFLEAKSCIVRLEGPARALLSGERVALNFLQHLSGIATATRRFVDAIRGTKAILLDTRKTIPGCRVLEKYAVTCGGGQNHRMGLHDMILIKDNHLASLAGAKPNPIAAAVTRARLAYPELKIEVEADTLLQVRQAAEAGSDMILLDNMSLPELQESVACVNGRSKTEASGGITLDSIRAIAETGVDFISAGAITHSARAVDIALDF